jgi:hypothetical protein
MQDDQLYIGVALGLILVGLVLLLSNLGAFGEGDGEPGQIWPVLIVLVGLFFLYQFFFGAEPNPGLVFVGTAITLLGLFLLFFTLHVELPFEFDNLSGPIEWGDFVHLWPALLLIVGMALVTMSLLTPDQDGFGPGLVALAVGLIAFPFTLGVPGPPEGLVKFWPLSLILMGCGMLFKKALRI